MTFQFLECGVKSPSGRACRAGHKTKYAAATAEFGLEPKYCFQGFGSGARDDAGWGAVRVDLEGERFGFCLCFADGLRKSGSAVYRGQMPGEGENVAPM